MENIDTWLEEGVYSVIEQIGQPASLEFVAEVFDMMAAESVWFRFTDRDRLRLVNAKLSKLVKKKRLFTMEYVSRLIPKGEQRVFGLTAWLKKGNIGILCKGQSKLQNCIISED